MDVGWSKLKTMVEGGTPNIGESTLKNLLVKGKNATVIEHRYLEGWIAEKALKSILSSGKNKMMLPHEIDGWHTLPKDIVAIVVIVRGPATLDNVELLIEELRRNVLYHNVEYMWTHIPDKTPSASAIVIHGKTDSLVFDRETGILTISRKYLVKLVKQNSGWEPGKYHVEPEIKKVRIV